MKEFTKKLLSIFALILLVPCALFCLLLCILSLTNKILILFAIFLPVFCGCVFAIIKICKNYRKQQSSIDNSDPNTLSSKAGKPANKKPFNKINFDFFGADKLKKENEILKKKVDNLQELISPEMQDAEKIQQKITDLKAELSQKQSEYDYVSNELLTINATIKNKKALLVDLDDELLYQEFALYTPKFNLMNSDKYKLQLERVRDKQKLLIKCGDAVTGSTNWTVNNSKTQGKKMVADMQKLLLRAFNSECDEIINKVTFSNVELSAKRIRTSCGNISKLGKMMGISISPAFEQSKIDELFLCYEYQVQKQREKEEQKELRAQMREEEKLRREIEEARRKIEKDQHHFQRALIKIISQLELASEEQKELLLLKKQEIEESLEEIEKSIADIDYREANAKAGYVYIISNLGAFGENVFKIGMTRRLDPMERVEELGDASVPFKFDVHAMIFSENAPALEAALHKAFESKKLNMVNQRREFFKVTLDEIKEVVNKNFDKTVEFIEIAPAQQYRESLKMKEVKM